MCRQIAAALNQFQRQRAEVLSGRSIRAETVRLRRDGARVDVSLNLAPIRGSGGEIIAISSIIHDISKRKAIERQLQFLMRELSHRSKNQLAIVQAIAGQMAQSAHSVDEFMSRFRTRLQGLAASHDLLISPDWTGVALVDLVRRQIETFGDRGDWLGAARTCNEFGKIRRAFRSEWRTKGRLVT